MTDTDALIDRIEIMCGTDDAEAVRSIIEERDSCALGSAGCFKCHRPIIASDDDDLVCIQCGGRNRRINP